MGLVGYMLEGFLEDAGDGGIWESVSIVLSDREGRVRPRASASCDNESVSKPVSKPSNLSFSEPPPSLVPAVETTRFC